MASQPERRDLGFQNLDEVLVEAERLASGEVRTTGNHTFGQILEHLALSTEAAAGKVEPPPAPLYMRLMIKLMKPFIINSKPLTPGVKLPKSGEQFFWPDRTFDVKEALTHLKDATAYYKANGAISIHPFFGKLTAQQALELNCRHAALHLSFVHPV